MTDAKIAKEDAVKKLADLMSNSYAVMEIYVQIKDSTGKSPFDIEVNAPSGKKLPYASVHRWIRILKDHGAIEKDREEDSKKGGKKIIYISTKTGEDAYRLAYEKVIQGFADRAEKESRNVKGLRAPELLEAVLDLWEKKEKRKR